MADATKPHVTADDMLEVLFGAVPTPTKGKPGSRQWLNVCAASGRTMPQDELCDDPDCVHMDLKERKLRAKEIADMVRVFPADHPPPGENSTTLEWHWAKHNVQGEMWTCLA